MRNHSYENDFDLHENETECKTHFHMKGFTLRLVLKLRLEGTQKWPTGIIFCFEHLFSMFSFCAVHLPHCKHEVWYPRIQGVAKDSFQDSREMW